MCASLCCDPLLRLPHPVYAAEAARQGIAYDTMMILVFIAYLQSPTDPTDNRKPPTIASYVSGLRHYWRAHLMDLGGFNHPLIAQYTPWSSPALTGSSPRTSSGSRSPWTW